MFGTNSDKPSAAEQMVAKLLGFTPEQMQATIMQLKDTITAVGASLKRVEDTQSAILAKLEAMEHGGRNDGSSGSGRALPAPGGDGGSSGDTSGGA